MKSGGRSIRVGSNDLEWTRKARRGVQLIWQLCIITLERFDLEWPNLAW